MKVEIYSKESGCPYCVRAKNFFNDRGIEYKIYDLEEDVKYLIEARNRAGDQNLRTVPQIFINDKHIGGYDDLMAKSQSGQINGLQ